MHSLPDSANKLIEEFSRLPGVGRKTAQRLAFHLLNSHKDVAFDLSDALKDVKNKVRECSMCFGISEEDLCKVCSDVKRVNDLLCVVENPQDIFIFEKTNTFRGKYHVLGGALSPLDGIGPDELNINSLIDRVSPDMEIILATNPSVEGETTALYLAKILDQKNVIVTRLARGLPVGSDLEYVDEATLVRAMEGRTSV